MHTNMYTTCIIIKKTEKIKNLVSWLSERVNIYSYKKIILFPIKIATTKKWHATQVKITLQVEGVVICKLSTLQYHSWKICGSSNNYDVFKRRNCSAGFSYANCIWTLLPGETLLWYLVKEEKMLTSKF